MDSREFLQQILLMVPEQRAQVAALVAATDYPPPVKRIVFARWLQRNHLKLDFDELDRVAQLEGK